MELSRRLFLCHDYGTVDTEQWDAEGSGNHEALDTEWAHELLRPKSVPLVSTRDSRGTQKTTDPRDSSDPYFWMMPFPVGGRRGRRDT